MHQKSETDEAQIMLKYFTTPPPPSRVISASLSLVQCAAVVCFSLAALEQR